MENIGSVEMYKWDREKLADAAFRVVDWYSFTMQKYGSLDWFNFGKEKLVPRILQKKLGSTEIFGEVAFRGKGISLAFLHPYPVTQLNDVSEKYGNLRERDPQFIFSAELGLLLPRELHQVLRIHEEIGREAREVLGAEFRDNSPTISFPREQFGSLVFRGSVLLMPHQPVNIQISNEIDTILKDLNF